MPFAANSAGLGKLTVTSGLGEPLSAEIELVQATAEELSSLTAAMAPDEAYATQGIEPPALRNSIKVELAKKANGSPVIKLSTQQPVNDPFLDMLIQVDWSTGRLLREYTVLLDPPGYTNNHSSGAGVSPATTKSSTNGAQQDKSVNGGSVKSTDKSRPAAQVAAPKKNSSEDYTTQRGDSLIGIARETLVQDVNLEQMMVGIYRANKSAFADGNMNRLKTGQIVRIPDSTEIKSISSKEANQEIRAQTEDWNSYRNKLARAVAESSGSDASSSQSSAGKIVAATVDKSAPATEGPRDVVKLSKMDSATDKNAADGKRALQEKLNALQEEATAREKSVKEANERVVALEKQIEDMKQLLAVKNQAMADLQKLAGNQAAEPKSVTPESDVKQNAAADKPAEVTSITPVDETNNQQNTPASNANANKVADADKPAAKKIVPPAPVESAGLFDELTDDPVLLGGAGGALLLLLGGGWLFLRNKRKHNLDSFEQSILTSGGLKANTVFGNSAEGKVDTTETSFLTDFSQSTTGEMIDAHDVDPVAEAEVYMAYGREAQAEEILKDAIKKEPKRYELHLKLLEIYAGRNDSFAFETIAGELYSTLGSSDPVWAKVSEIGRKMEPDNPLYQVAMGAVGTAVAAEIQKPDTNNFTGAEDMNKPSLDFTLDSDTDDTQPKMTGEQSAQDSSLDFDLEMTKDASVEESLPEIGMTDDNFVEPQKSESSNDLDFQLDLPEKTAENTVQVDVSDFGQTMPGFEMPQYEKPETKTADIPSAPAFESSLPEISFDLPELSNGSPSKAASEPEQTPPLDLPDFGNIEVTEVDSVSEEIVFETVPEQSNELDFNFDTNFGASETPLKTEADNGKVPEIDLSGISFDLDSTPSTTAIEVTGAAAESPEVDTKLDLVTAYMDMGDIEGARELLDEVLKEGGPQQRERAQQVLNSLG